MTAVPVSPSADPRGKDSPDSPEAAVIVDSVSKRFGTSAVLDSVTLSVPRGGIFGLIGPSGCGKTTLIRVLVGVLSQDGGEVRVLGVEPSSFSTHDRARIGYTPQGFYLYPTLTVLENARFVAGLYGVSWWRRRSRVRATLQLLEIWDARNRLARDISGGMQRRLALACALTHQPTLLLVDEPTAGLDPVLREKIWEHLRALVDEGCTVVVTTQYIDEAVYCDMVAVMNEGRIEAIGTPEELRQRAIGGETLDVESERALDRDDVLALWQLPSVQSVERRSDTALRLLVDDAAASTPVITIALRDRGHDLASVQPYVPAFEDVFLAIVGAR